jgi:hypothetical protein
MSQKINNEITNYSDVNAVFYTGIAARIKIYKFLQGEIGFNFTASFYTEQPLYDLHPYLRVIFAF